MLEPRALLASLSVGSVVNVSRAAENQIQPAIAINPANPQNLVVFADEVGGKGLLESTSTDGGKTWSSRAVATGSDSLPAASGQASAVFDALGDLFLTYLDSTRTRAAVVVSTDGGQTLSLVTTLTDVANEPQVAIGPASASGGSNLWVAFRDASGGISLTGASITGPGQVGAFTAPEEATGSIGGDFPRLSVGPKGQVVVVFENPSNTLGPAGIFAATDPDGLGSKVFNASVHVTDVNVGGLSKVPAQPVRPFDSEAAVAYDTSGQTHNGRLYLVKTDAFNPGDQPTGLFVEFSDDDGATWSPDVFVDSTAATATQFLPRIAVDPATGVVGLSWLDTRNDTGSGAGDTDGKGNTDVELFTSVSLDGGATFLPSVKVASGPSNAIKAGGGTDDQGFDYGGYTGLAFFNNVMYPSWADNSSALTGNPDAPNLEIATAAVTVVGGPPPLNNLKVTATAPTAVEGAGFTGQVATFVDLGSAKPLSAYTATINWGDGTPPTLGTVAASAQGAFTVTGTHAYAEEGSATITITVSANGAGSASGSAVVKVADAPLSAVPGGVVNAIEGTSLAGVTLVHFTDANPLGALADYSATINWGDGTPPSAGKVVVDPQGGFDVTGTHTYEEGGSYTASVAVNDDGGASVSQQVSVAVADLPLTAHAVPNLAMLEGSTAMLVLATFTDADPHAQVSQYTASIDWGDGTTSPGVVTVDPRGGFDISGSHALDEGSANITVSVADAGGSTATVNEAIRINDAPLSPGRLILNAFEGIPLSDAVVATFSDANLQAPAADFTASIDWGNGSKSAGTIVAQGNGTFGVMATQRYALPGTYAVTVTVHDVGGSQTVVRSSVIVQDAPLSAQGRVISLVEGQGFSGVLASFTDANPAGALRDFSATIEWSDNTTTTGVLTADPRGGFDVSGSHTFALGVSTVIITIKDVRGATATAGTTVIVADAPLTVTGAVVTALDHLPAANLRVASLIDGDPAPSASKLSATIAWGDGGLSTGTIVPAPGGPGHYAVLGSHTYQVPGVFPVTVAIADQGGSVAVAASATYVANLILPLTGRLDAASDTGSSASDGITRVNQPRFAGEAEAGSRVQLYAQRVGQAGIFPVGQTVAGPDGAWSTRIGPLADGMYFVDALAIDAFGNPASPWTGLMPSGSAGPLVIDTTGPQVLGSTLDPRTGRVQVVFAADAGPLNPQALANPALYALAAAGAPPLPISGLNVAPATPAGLAVVSFTVNGGRSLRSGRYTLTIAAAGAFDLAGNALAERVFVPAGPLTALPPGSYAAQFDTNGQSLALGSFVSALPPPTFPGRSGRLRLARVALQGL